MKKVKDKFSRQSKKYKKFRPTYPIELFKHIYSFCPIKDSAWDCGTGNGQVAVALSKSFKKVFATDISKKQIQNTTHKENIFYSVERSEKTSFLNNSFDLITVAQAIHWFDFKSFNKEVKRVLKPDGIIAIWGYGLLKINPEIDEIINHFYYNIINMYWDKERDHIDNNYSTVLFDFDEIQITKKIEIQEQWTIIQLEGYFNSWSSVQNYIDKNNGLNPVDELIKEIIQKWKTELKQITFPIFLRIGSNN